MKKLITFIIIITILALASVFNISEAIKLIDDEKMQAGIFDELLENELVVAINPNKLFKATAVNEEDSCTLLKGNIEEIFAKSNITIANIKNKNGKVYNDKTAIGTGATVNANDNNTYKVLLYGDANGDGRICNSMDIDVIRQDYVFNNKAEGAYKLAADLQADGTLNVRDVQRMVKKYIGQLDGTLVTPFPDEEIPELVITPSEDIYLRKNETQTITSNVKVEWLWDEDSEVADVVVKDDGSITVTGINPGEVEITAIDEFGNEKTITVTVINTVTATLAITENTPGVVCVEVSLEGAEIDGIRYLYRNEKENNWEVDENFSTEEKYIYKNVAYMIKGDTYEFKAEIIGTDGNTYETNVVSCEILENRELILNPNEDFSLGVGESKDITAVDTEVEWSWDKDSNVADVVVKDDGSITVTGINPGEVEIIAIDEFGNEKTITITIGFKAKLELTENTPGLVSVKVILTEPLEDIDGISYLYRDSDETEWETSSDLSYALEYKYITDHMTAGYTYEFKAEIIGTDGNTYETNVVSCEILEQGQTLEVEEAVAKNVNTERYYTSLQFAVENSKQNQTIQILKEITNTDEVYINKDIKIDLNGKTTNNHFSVAGNVVFTDTTSVTGTIDTLNDDVNSAIEVSENGSVTLENGVNVKAYTYCIEGNSNTTINVIEANLTQELPSDVSIDSSNTNNAAIRVNGGNLIISDNEEVARVNIYSDRYAIYSDSFESIKINNSEEQDDGVYKYEIYGDVSALSITSEGSEQKNIKINSGKFSAAPYVDRTVISLTGSIKLDTTGGIIGDLETGIGIRAIHTTTDGTNCYIPKLLINGSTKIFALNTGIYVGNSRYNIPNADVFLEIGTDNDGISTGEGVQISAEQQGIYIGTTGTTNIIIGKQDGNYNEQNSLEDTLENANPLIIASRASGGTYGIFSSGTTNIEINCKAVIIGDLYAINNRQPTITTSNNSEIYEVVTEEIVNPNNPSLNSKIVYVKSKK